MNNIEDLSTRINFQRDCKYPLTPASTLYLDLAIFFFALALIAVWFL